MIALLGRKLGMTQKFAEDGGVVPLTALECGPYTVVQIKTSEKDGYNAIQIGFCKLKKTKRVSSPLMGHFKKAGVDGFAHLTECRTDEVSLFKVGDVLDVSVFKVGDRIDVRGKTKGRGFQGVVKRHGKKGGGAAHGSHFHRAPGSIGMNSWPARVIKNMGMPGHMGDEFVTIKNLEVVDVDPEKNILFVKGAVPGAPNSIVKISAAKLSFKDRLGSSGAQKSDS